MTMKFTDSAQPGTVKKTSEGYLVAHAKALRTGVQNYLPGELGLMADGYPTGYVRVNRPEESVFDADALSTMAQKPLTLGHPDEDVTPENYADLAIGHVTNKFAKDGEWVALEVMVTDQRGIDAINNGTVELSAGYIADMAAVEHDEYDFVMGKPTFNHLALVPAGRAGHEARIGDSAQKPWGAAPQPVTEEEVEMPTEMKTVVVGDKAVQVAAADAEIITAMQKDHAKALEEKDVKIAELKTECADTAKKVISDEDLAKKIQDGVKEIATVAEKARKLVKDYDATDKDSMTIRREVIKSVYGDEAIEDLKTDAEIKAAFAVARVEEKADPVLTRDASPKMKEKKEKGAWDGMYKAKKEDK